MSENIVMTREQTLKQVMSSITSRERVVRPMIEDSGISWDVFKSNAIQLLRTRPDVLDCTVASIVNACIEAAHDGLRLDGKEATIGPRSVKISNNPKRYEKQAIYIPMAHGMIQQIYRASEGKVKSLQVEVVYKNDQYQVSAGHNPQIIHFPVVDGEKGPIIGAYAIAEYAAGGYVTERLDAEDLAQIRGKAEQDYIWKEWPGEMSKKSAIRRIRKRLPIGHGPVFDMEAARMFPQMQQQQSALPDESMPARPTRASIANQAGTAAGADMDLGADDDGVIIEQGQQTQQQQGRNQNDSNQAQQQQDHSADAGKKVELPEDEGAWSAWVKDVEERLRKADSADAVTDIAREEEERIQASNTDRANWVRGLITDRMTDLTGDEE